MACLSLLAFVKQSQIPKHLKHCYSNRQICCQKITVVFPFLQREKKFHAEMFRLGILKEAQQMNYGSFPMIQCNMNLPEYTDFSITCELCGHLKLTEINSFIPMSILLHSLLYIVGQFSYKFHSQYISKDYMGFQDLF